MPFLLIVALSSLIVKLVIDWLANWLSVTELAIAVSRLTHLATALDGSS
jgi:hypothetical protein